MATSFETEPWQEKIIIWYRFDIQGHFVTLLHDFDGCYACDLQEEILKNEEFVGTFSASSLLLELHHPGTSRIEILDEELVEKFGGMADLFLAFENGPYNPLIACPPNNHWRVPAQDTEDDVISVPELLNFARRALDKPKETLPSEMIELELAKIVDSAHKNHRLHKVEASEAEKYYKQRLGRFFNKPLSYDVSLPSPVMFGRLNEMAPVTGQNETLFDIIEKDIDKASDRRTVAMVARTGSGKTATVTDLATHHFAFVIYILCTSSILPKPPGNRDANFEILANNVQYMASKLPEPNSADTLAQNDEFLKSAIDVRVTVEFLGRLLFLMVLLKIDSQLTPEQFYREQLRVDGILTTAFLIRKLIPFHKESIDAMLGTVMGYLPALLNKRALVIALDQAHIAAEILKDELLSSSSLKVNDETNLLEHDRCSFLKLLCMSLSRFPSTLVVLGTAMSLIHALSREDQIFTEIGKEKMIVKMFNFPLCNVNDVEEMIKNTVDVSNCSFPRGKCQRLVGRLQLTTGVITRLQDRDPRVSKQEVLNSAFDKTIADMKQYLKSKVKRLLESDNADQIVNLFGRMVLAYKLRNGKISFPQQPQVDLVDQALCTLQEGSGGYHWIMDEPLVVEVVEKELKASKIDPIFCMYLDYYKAIIINLDVTSATFGPLVWGSLRRFNGTNLTELPFLKSLQLPEWCKRFQLQMDCFGTAEELGYGSGVQGDLEFYKNYPQNLLLVPNNTGPDGAFFFPDPQYATSVVIRITATPLDPNICLKNETSSDIRRSFKSDGGVNPSLEEIQKQFESSRAYKLKGILRLHLEFSSHLEVLPSRVDIVKNGSGDILQEDVMVHINCSNIDEFFDESINKSRRDTLILKNIINYISLQPKKKY